MSPAEAVNVLDQLDPKIANSLFLRSALLGPCGTAVVKLRTRKPEAAETFLSKVNTIAATAPESSDRLAFLQAAAEDICTELRAYGEVTADFCDWCTAIVQQVSAYSLDPFAEANRIAVVAAARFYSGLGLTAARLHSEFPVEIQWCNKPPGNYGSARGITATVIVIPEKKLVVKVHPGAFDQDAVCAMPYLLFHEHICHSARVALGGPPPQNQTSSFGDGWMDFVALRLLEHAIESQEPLGLPWISPWEHQNAAARLHTDRHDAASFDRDANYRRFGRDVAQAFESRYPATAQQLSPLWPISAGLNGSSESDLRLDEFVYAVDWICRDPVGVIKLAALVRDQSLSAGELINAALGLVR